MSGQFARLSLSRKNEKSIHAFWRTGSECADILLAMRAVITMPKGVVSASAAKWYRPDIPAAAKPSVDAR